MVAPADGGPGSPATLHDAVGNLAIDRQRMVPHAWPMKSSILTETVRNLARSMGLIGEMEGTHQHVAMGERSPEVVAEALAAAKRIRARAKRMKLSVTDDDILRWVKAGRR